MSRCGPTLSPRAPTEPESESHPCAPASGPALQSSGRTARRLPTRRRAPRALKCCRRALAGWHAPGPTDLSGSLRLRLRLALAASHGPGDADGMRASLPVSAGMPLGASEWCWGSALARRRAGRSHCQCRASDSAACHCGSDSHWHMRTQCRPRLGRHGHGAASQFWHHDVCVVTVLPVNCTGKWHRPGCGPALAPAGPKAGVKSSCTGAGPAQLLGMSTNLNSVARGARTCCSQILQLWQYPCIASASSGQLRVP